MDEKPIKTQSGTSEESAKSGASDLYLIPLDATDEDIEALLDEMLGPEQTEPQPT